MLASFGSDGVASLLSLVLLASANTPAPPHGVDERMAMQSVATRLGIEGRFPSMARGTGWINSPPLTPEALRGKVVMVNVWTYSCINSLRPLPFIRAWAEKYKDAGLVVIGVHSPEFEFEHDPANVRRAVTDMHVGFPVVLDNDFGIWRAFDNQYWPAFYFIDAEGRIRYHRFGEEQYEKSERVIQQLLAEAGAKNVPSGFVTPAGVGVEAPPAAVSAESAETYLGYAQAHSLVSAEGVARDRTRFYRGADPSRIDEWSIAGEWAIERERIVLAKPGGRIAYRFRARDLHVVMGPSDAGKPVRFRISVDGKAPGSDHGSDVDGEGIGVIDTHRLYQLVRQSQNTKDRLFEIEFLDGGAQAYVFTFG